MARVGAPGDAEAVVGTSSAVLRSLLSIALWGTALGILAASAPGQAPERVVLEADVAGNVDPAMRAAVSDAIERAAERDAAALVLRLDTPGGLDTAMREIVQDILAAPVPVLVHVAPDGARAASAGLFVTLAGHVAAMAPQTNIGSASPISIGPGAQDEVLGRKVRNDAAAYATALAEGRGRDIGLARRMVLDAVNVPASEALDRGLVDVVAADTDALLEQVDGMRLRGPAPVATLQVTGATVERLDVPVTVQIQRVLLNPTVAFLLVMAGLAGLAFELLSPGLVGPGLFGAVALVLGVYGTAQLPVNATGVVLLLLGVGFLVAETQISGGLLGLAGAIGLAAGGVLLFDGDVDALRVSVPAAIATGAGAAAFTVVAASKVVSARSAPPRGGSEELVGRHGTVRSPLDPDGHVHVDGALWRAHANGAGVVLEPGRRVRVERVEGLTLTVRPVDPDAEPPPEESPQ